ncbi:hypothetical protein B0H34DRAFT_686097 [Crassisporium funariophilum]|nr:hypothetical protein B0H34DRAFT_686097 [Crassisporium funariophilum]
MAERLATCAANASKHPGLANKANDIPRRSQAQVQAERAAKAREKAEKQARLRRSSQPRFHEVRVLAKGSHRSLTEVQGNLTTIPPQDQQPGLNAMDVDPLPSGSDYNPEKEGEGESEPEPEVELDNDEPDTMIQHNKGGKKEKRGLLARQKIKSLRDANGSSMESEDLVPKQAAEATKRKAEAGSGLAQNG